VEEIHVKVGQTVKKGDPLVALFSTDLVAAKIDYKTARSELEREQSKLRWSQEMFAKSYVSEGQLSAARNAEERRRLRVQLARDKLSVYGLTEEEIENIEKEDSHRKARLTLRSPIAGTVIEVGAVPGNLYDTKDVLMVIHGTQPDKPTVP